MSDKIRVKPEELEGRILEDIQKDLARTVVEDSSVPVPQVGLEVTSRDNPDNFTIEWDTDSSAPKIESSVSSDETAGLRKSVSKPAETISSQGYNPNGGSVGSDQPYDNGLKPGTTMPYDGLDDDGGSETGGVSPTGEDYDDSYGGNGYGSSRRGNQRKKPEEEKKDPNEDPNKTPNKDGDKTGGKKGTGEDGEAGSETGTPKTQSELDKDKADALKKDKEDDAVDKAATSSMVANGDPNAGTAQKQQGETATPKKEEPERPQEDETGNGYGALNKKKGAPQNDPNDATARARRNLEHQNKVNNGDSKPSQSKKPKNSSASTPKSGSPIKNALARVGNGLKNKAN